MTNQQSDNTGVSSG